VSISNIKRNSTVTLKFTFTNKDGSVKDITGWKIHFTAKRKILDADIDAEISLTFTAGDVIGDDPLNGIMYLVIDSDSSKVEPQTLAYNFVREVIGTPPDLVVIEQGTVEIERNTLIGT